MSTSAVVNDIAIKPENIDFVVTAEQSHVTTKDEAGNDVTTVKSTLKHTSSEKEIAKIKEAGRVLFEQTVTTYKVGTESGFVELIPDEAERINIINRGIASKFNQKIKATLTETDEVGNPAFVPVDGAYDSKVLLQEETQRRSMSETEKALKMLQGMDSAVVAALLKQLGIAPAAEATE